MKAGQTRPTYYLAGPYNRRAALRALTTGAFAGWTCTSRWLTTIEESDVQAAQTDLIDLAAAEVLIVDARVDSTTGGLWVEFGVALARLLMPIIVITTMDIDLLPVFTALPRVRIVTDELRARAELVRITTGSTA